MPHEPQPSNPADDFGQMMNERLRGARGSVTPGFSLPADAVAMGDFIRRRQPAAPAAEQAEPSETDGEVYARLMRLALR